MKKCTQLLFVCALHGGCSPLVQAATVSIPAAQTSVLNKWLQGAPDYRLANMQDCACAAEVDALRQGGGAYRPVPDYLPFYAAGSFDGTPGFAALVIRKNKPFDAKIVVFSGVPARAPAVLRYPFGTDTSLEAIGLFKNAKRHRPDELLIGTFGSEAEVVRVPSAAKQSGMRR